MSTTIKTPSLFHNGYNNFNKIYALRRKDVNELVTFLNTGTFIDNIELLFSNPIDNVISLRAYPFDIFEKYPDKRDMTPVIINVVNTPVNGFLNPVSAPPFNLGKITISRYFNNFLDFSPYTKIEIYLPYIGFVALDPSIVMGERISIDYVVDYFSGKCTAFLSVETQGGTDLPSSYVFMECDGTIGIDIAIGGGQGADIARNMLKLGISATAGAISIGAGAVALGSTATAGSVVGAAKLTSMSAGFFAGTTTNAIQAGQVHINKGGTTQPSIGFYAPQNCYLIITRPNVQEPTTYAHDYGKPSGKSVVLGRLTGFTVVDSVHVDGIGTATADELTEIERLLKTGVIF